ncbi:MAG: glycosyltransferase [Caldilineaceae bacterium]|nr:glycosyltransferase [Caldilineaceae bacterium]
MDEPQHGEGLRVAFYSHDTQGLGHIRRNLAIAAAFAQMADPPTNLMISGTAIAGSFQLPSKTDMLALPAVGKDAHGRYHSSGLSLPLESVIRLRAHTMRAALEDFAPHVLIVDKVAGGLQDELLPALRMLRRRGTRCVLGLRDVLDDALTARREWAAMRTSEMIDAYYGAVWIYGDPKVYNPIQEYQLPPAVAAKVRFTGYIDRTRAQTARARAADQAAIRDLLPRPGTRLALCMVGGGEDGERLATAFAHAPLPDDMQGLLITGPYMPQAAQAQLDLHAQQRDDLAVVQFLPAPEALLPHADAVISMGGYNTVSEILAHRKRSLIVPRVAPRREQWERAQRLTDLGALDMLAPEQVNPVRLGDWLAATLHDSAPLQCDIDLEGLERLPGLLAEVAATAARRSPVYLPGSRRISVLAQHAPAQWQPALLHGTPS